MFLNNPQIYRRILEEIIILIQAILNKLLFVLDINVHIAMLTVFLIKLEMSRTNWNKMMPTKS